MTALTVTEYSTEDLPINLISGTSKRRLRVYIRGTATGGGSLNLATLVPAIADVEGVVYYTDNNVALTPETATWSTTTVTWPTTAGTIESCLVVTLT